jgi:hypothetical protein
MQNLCMFVLMRVSSKGTYLGSCVELDEWLKKLSKLAAFGKNSLGTLSPTRHRTTSLV